MKKYREKYKEIYLNIKKVIFKKITNKKHQRIPEYLYKDVGYDDREYHENYKK